MGCNAAVKSVVLLPLPNQVNATERKSSLRFFSFFLCGWYVCAANWTSYFLSVDNHKFRWSPFLLLLPLLLPKPHHPAAHSNWIQFRAVRRCQNRTATLHNSIANIMCIITIITSHISRPPHCSCSLCVFANAERYTFYYVENVSNGQQQLYVQTHFGMGKLLLEPLAHETHSPYTFDGCATLKNFHTKIHNTQLTTQSRTVFTGICISEHSTADPNEPKVPHAVVQIITMYNVCVL